MPELDACDACLRRSWLVSRLTANLDRIRGRTEEVLGLGEEDLLAALAGREASLFTGELEQVSPRDLRDSVLRARQGAICGCSAAYPARLRDLPSPPAVLFTDGDRAAIGADGELRPAVALVGSRSPTTYGREVAMMLGRGLASAGVCVISGMAFGIDAAAHRGALDGGGPTIAVLPGGAGRAYPQAHRSLAEEIRRRGATLAELLPGAPARRWTFTARNRIIAGLAEMVIVVEAKRRSGSLVTAAVAGSLGRTLGAVPGRISSPLSAGTHDLLREGAVLVRSVEDVLEELSGWERPPGLASDRGSSRDGRRSPEQRGRFGHDREPMGEAAHRLHGELIGSGDLSSAAAAAGLDTPAALAAVAELELGGWVRRGPGGSWEARM